MTELEDLKRTLSQLEGRERARAKAVLKHLPEMEGATWDQIIEAFSEKLEKRLEQNQVLHKQISLIAVEFCRVDLPPYDGFRSLPKDAKWVVDQLQEQRQLVEDLTEDMGGAGPGSVTAQPGPEDLEQMSANLHREPPGRVLAMEEKTLIWHCGNCKEVVYGNTCKGCGDYIATPGGGGE